MRFRQGKLVWALFIVVGLFLVVALVAGVAYLVLRAQQREPQGWSDPLAAIVEQEIAPDLALYPLAGASQLDTVDAAVDNGELETAYATLGYAKGLSDRQRIGRLVILAGRFAEAKELQKAVLCYQQIYDLALLSPSLNDPLRADALRVVGEGWAGLGREALAMAALDQVRLLALSSPNLYAAQRRELLAALEDTYVRLRRPKEAQEIRAALVALEQDSGSGRPRAAAVAADLPMGQDALSSAQLGALEETRRRAAYALIGPLALGQEPPAELVRSLAEALLAEDAAKQAAYSEELDRTTQSSRRIDIQWQMIRWLLVKLQVARRDLGLSVVPQWESQSADIQSALSKAFEDLHFDYEDWATALPDVSLLAPSRYESRRLIILQGRLGQYPNYPAAQLLQKLASAAGDLVAAGRADAVYVATAPESSAVDLVWEVGAEYGRSRQTP